MKLQRQIDDLLARQASEWHQVLEGGERAQRAAFVAWLKQSPLHVREYLETTYTDRVLRHVDSERLEDVDALIAQAAPEVVPFSGANRAWTQSKGMPGRSSTLAIAASIVVCALSAAWLYQAFWAGEQFSTAIGEQRTIQLPDASTVMLNADSTIKVRFDEGRRHIELKRGEAWFEVARDAARPFEVRTPTASVQVLGTQFNIYERREGARVSVVEGAVNVQALDSSAAQRLGAGEEAQVGSNGTVRRNPHIDLTKATAWRERKLIFEDAPLEEMVHEFNRYNRTPRLKLEGIPAGTHHYNGTFSATDPQSLAVLLSGEPDLIVEARRGEILIQRRR